MSPRRIVRALLSRARAAAAVMRFAPVEVITRYYQQPIAAKDGESPSRSGSPTAGRRGSGSPIPGRRGSAKAGGVQLGYPGSALDTAERWLGEQAYDHDFEVRACPAHRPRRPGSEWSRFRRAAPPPRPTD